MARATIAFVLHAHLPWVDPVAEDDTIEGRWILEAITECYLPLLDVFGALAADAIPVRLTCSLSPPLLAQLAHPTLPARYARHLDRLDRVLDAERARTRGTPLAPVVDWHRARLAAARRRFFDRHAGDLVTAWREVGASGRVELQSSALTHALLSLLTPPWARAQIAGGLDVFRRHVGGGATGFWLPECAYTPEIDEPLLAAGIRHVVVDTHAVALGTPRPVYGAHAPVASPSGLIVVAREPEGSAQVWSATHGYPGDPWYLDHHADIGWTLAPRDLHDVLRLPPGGGPLGIRHHRVTGSGEPKAPYEPGRAAERVAAHARHFVDAAALRSLELGAAMDRPPLLLYAFDAELFGHWWFEGPGWLDRVLRALADHADLAARTTTDDLALHPIVQRVTPSASTWGAGGHHATWLDPSTAGAHASIARLGDELLRLARSHPAAPTVEAAVRHLLLAQSSDWPFMITRGTSAPYGRRRLDGHLAACRRLCEATTGGGVAEPSDLDGDRSFPSIDPGVLEPTMPLS